MNLEYLSNNKNIKSFVLRNNKLTTNQKILIKKFMPMWSIPYVNEYVELNEIFASTNPKILDIGFGNGNTTIEFAKIFPNYDFVAVDVYSIGVANLLKLIHLNNINNIRIIQYDVVDIVNNMLKDNSLYGVHIFFPDPWPKKRHHKRRLIQENFVYKLNKLLVTGGYIHIATDCEDYALNILELLNNCNNLVNEFENFSTQKNCRPVTKFELKGKQQGRQIRDLIFKKCKIS